MYIPRGLFGISVEELLAYEAESVGPPVIVGEPGERIPRLGAAREYLVGEWKPFVENLLSVAALRMFILADTENFLWEFRTARERCGSRRLLLIVPPIRRKSSLELRWQRFAERNSDLVGSGLPTRLPDSPLIVVFFRQNQPVLMVSRKRTAWEYVIAIRLFICVEREDCGTIADVTGYLQASAPSVITNH